MVGAACERVMDHQIIVTWPISTVDTSNKDQALVMDLRKKDMIKNINVIMLILMLELLELSPVIPWFGLKQFAERVLQKEFCGKSFAERVRLAAD